MKSIFIVLFLSTSFAQASPELDRMNNAFADYFYVARLLQLRGDVRAEPAEFQGYPAVRFVMGLSNGDNCQVFNLESGPVAYTGYQTRKYFAECSSRGTTASWWDQGFRNFPIPKFEVSLKKASKRASPRD